MAEKGGKGFSLPNSLGKTPPSAGKGVRKGVETPSSTGKGGKGAETPSSTAKGGGKGSSNLSKQGKRTVHFDTSSDSDSEGDSPTPNIASSGNWGKGGKPSVAVGVGDKTGGGKPTAIPINKVPDPPKFDIEAELPKNAKCMMDFEAQDALQKIQEHLVTLSEDPSIKMPDSFYKGVKYANSAAGYTNPEAAKRLLEGLKKQKVSESEICLIGNICPDDAKELFALMPALEEKRRKNERSIEDVVRDLAKFKSSS